LDRFEKAHLRILLKNGNEMEKDKLVESFPNDKLSQAYDALLRLIQLRYVTLKYVGEKCIVVLPKIMEEEALRIVEPDFKIQNANTPRGELIPRDYVAEPFHKFYGEKEIHKAVSEYWLCHKKKDKDFVGCFIFNADGTRSSIAIGRLADANSLVSKYLEEIDRIFQGRVFAKSELAHKLPRCLVRNRQPIKAVTEYLVIEGYLERIEGTSKFKRTNKIHVVDSLDQLSRPKEHAVAKPTPSQWINGKPLYYYDEADEALYPNLQ